MLPNDTREIILVSPVWNDSNRLSIFGPQLAAKLKESELPIRWVVADDGSSPDEAEKISDLVNSFGTLYSNVDLVRLESRSRKGGAIYSAWDLFPDAKWLSFVDADGAISADSMIRLIQTALSEDCSGYVGIRKNSEEAPLKRDLGRSLSFRLFRLLVRLLTGLNYQDTQCGAKIILGRAYRSVASKLKERNYVFDVELLLALRCLDISCAEKAVPWKEIEGGKVRPMHDAWPMIAALWRIRRRLRSGFYYSAP
ncbi:MAG: glycosyltransferase [Verrucomicrobiota bacterium]